MEEGEASLALIHGWRVQIVSWDRLSIIFCKMCTRVSCSFPEGNHRCFYLIRAVWYNFSVYFLLLALIKSIRFSISATSMDSGSGLCSGECNGDWIGPAGSQWFPYFYSGLPRLDLPWPYCDLEGCTLFLRKQRGSALHFVSILFHKNTSEWKSYMANIVCKM